MAISFSRSVRSLHQDSFRPTLVSLSIIIALLAAWGAWFAFASVTIYEYGTDVHASRNGDVLAHFGAAATQRLRPGQSAELTLPATADAPAKTFPALLMEVQRFQPG